MQFLALQLFHPPMNVPQFPRGGFRKDLKKIAKRRLDRDALDAVVGLLCERAALPAHCRPHKLAGEWLGYWECHIAPNWLLIYKVTEHTVRLARTGSHSDLFD